MIYILRIYVELAYLILKNGCKNEIFVYRFELSKYEYKNDIKILKEMAPNYGMAIIEEKNFIRIEIVNKELYDKMYKLLYSCYYTNRYIFNDNDILLQMLISDKLLSNTYLNLEEFADEIGFSKSNLRNPVKKTREFLKKYGIDTYGKPYYGLCAKGNEFDIRICLSDIYVKLTPELLFIGNGKQYIDDFDYSSIYTSFVDYCSHNNFKFSAEDNKAICYYLSVTKYRLTKGYKMDTMNVETALLEKLLKNESLIAAATDILSYLQLETNHQEILAFMIVLFTSNISTDDTVSYIQTLYADEKNELEKRVISKLKEIYHLNIQENIFLNAISDELNVIIIKKHTGRMDKMTERFLGRTPNVHSFPLCYFINESLKDILSDYYHLKINRAVTETLADIVYYYIENLDFSFKKYNLLVASRFDRYAPALLKKKLEKDIDQMYIEKVDTCDHFSDVLNHTDEFVKRYDLIITDSKALNVKNGISFSDVNNSIVNLETYLRMNRDMCSCLGKESDIQIIHHNIDMNKIEKLEKVISKYGVFQYSEINESIQHAYFLKGIISLLIPYNGEECILQFGDFSSPLIINNQKVYSYNIFKGQLSENNIRIVNVILHELVLDPIFVETLKLNPNKNTLNEQINMIIK